MDTWHLERSRDRLEGIHAHMSSPPSKARFPLKPQKGGSTKDTQIHVHTSTLESSMLEKATDTSADLQRCPIRDLPMSQAKPSLQGPTEVAPEEAPAPEPVLLGSSVTLRAGDMPKMDGSPECTLWIPFLFGGPTENYQLPSNGVRLLGNSTGKTNKQGLYPRLALGGSESPSDLLEAELVANDPFMLSGEDLSPPKQGLNLKLVFFGVQKDLDPCTSARCH